MGTLLALISFAAFIAFFVGLAKPKLVLMPNRKRSSLVYIAVFIVAAVAGAKLDPTPKTAADIKTESEPKAAEPAKFEYADLSLSDYRHKAQSTRHEIIVDYVNFKKIDAKSSDSFYACMSENSLLKDGDLPLSTVLEWCEGEYESNPAALSKHINLDAFQANVSGWDSSYRPLEILIKKNMNDEDSYKHVETVSSIILGKDPHGIVKTTFKGKNAFGGVVKEQVTARVDLKTGDIVSIIKK